MNPPSVFRTSFLGRFLTLALAFCGLATGSGLPCRAAASVADSLSEEVRAVFERSRGAVVKVEASDREGQLCGTGFFVDPNGLLYTSYSVGGDSRDITVTVGDAKYPAQRLIADCRSGIAILKVENKGDAPLSFLPLAKSTELTVATPVVTIGYPLDMPLTPNFGLVAGFDLKYLGRFFATTHIRANVPAKRGEGGAPLLNMRGEVVGIVISSLDDGAASFALPIEAAQKIHRDYVRFGTLRPGRLGVIVRESGTATQGSTAEVDDLEEGAAALSAGIQKGDIVTRIGDIAIKAPEDVLNAGFYLTAGEPVPVTVLRDNQAITVTVAPGERNPARAGSQAPSPIGTDITLRLR